MIFRSSYRRFVASKQIKSGSLTFFKSLLWVLISVILTLGVYFGMQVLARNASSTIPSFLYNTHFGLLYLYTIINFFVIFIVLIINIGFICFPEITTNRWNLMTSMGIPISGLVGTKIVTSVVVVARQYLIGYLVVILSGLVLQLPFSINYLIALFFCGIVNFVLLLLIAMAMSVFSKRVDHARSFLFLSFLIVQALDIYFKFYHSDAFQSQVLIDMFSLRPSSFLVVASILTLICYAIILFVARDRSRYQELMPLGVFDIRPLVSGGETELFMTQGLKHTTILDTEILKEERENHVPRPVEKPDTSSIEDGPAFPYTLFIVVCIVIAVLSILAFLLLILAPAVMVSVIGEGLTATFSSGAGKIILAGIGIVFIIFAVVLATVRKREREQR